MSIVFVDIYTLPCSAFYFGARDPNPGSHDYVSSPLSTELSPHPQYNSDLETQFIVEEKEKS